MKTRTCTHQYPHVSIWTTHTRALLVTPPHPHPHPHTPTHTQTQCILYRRYPDVLAPFKYAGYPLLLTAITTTLADDPPPSTGTPTTTTGGTLPSAQGPSTQQARHFLGPAEAPQLTASVQLCSLTCVSSALNGEELTRSGGVETLGGLLQRCVAVTAADVGQHLPEALLITHCLGALAGMAAFPLGRGELLQRYVVYGGCGCGVWCGVWCGVCCSGHMCHHHVSPKYTPTYITPPQKKNSQSLVADIIRCCRYIRAPAAVDAALACIINMAASSDLQHMLLHQGALPFVIPLLFAYDMTHSTDDDLQVLEHHTTRGPGFLLVGIERHNQQDARNRHALLAARVLGRLGGLLAGPLETPVCEDVRTALGALLTEPLLPRLGEVDPRPLLVDLNSSVATPQAVWNGSMRAELLSAMEAQQTGEVGLDSTPQFRYGKGNCIGVCVWYVPCREDGCTCNHIHNS